MFLFDINQDFRVIPSFRTHFAGKCDSQSRDLTQLPCGYINSRLNLTIKPCSSCWMHSWENVVEKYSKWFCNFLCFSGIWTQQLWCREQSLYQLGQPPYINFKTYLGKEGGQGAFPAFRPCFAGKCDQQLSDLTQISSGYNFAITPVSNHHSSEEKYSK